MRIQFWPFTNFLRKLLPGVAKKFKNLYNRPRITAIGRIAKIGAAESSGVKESEATLVTLERRMLRTKQMPVVLFSRVAK